MSEEEMRALFVIAGIPIERVWRLENQYFLAGSPHAVARPWWLVKTPFGLIQIGWRKRVIAIDWSDTATRLVITKDDVTKDETSVHAWSTIKALEYLAALAVALPASTLAPAPLDNSHSTNDLGGSTDG